ncbi:MAG TPA: HPP family protein [Nannocystis sp.]
MHRLARAARVFAGAGVAITVCSVMALETGMPWCFPSLGPTAFLAVAAPESPANRPRRVLLGHAIAIVCGGLALWVFGLGDAPPAFETGVDAARVGAVSLALAATGGLAVLLDAEHPPAGATTLIVALGLLRAPRDLALMEVAVLVLVVVCAGLRRIGLSDVA